MSRRMKLYLQGRFFHKSPLRKRDGQALAAFERAVQLDPKFALAWAGLAQTHVWDCNYATEGGQKGFNAHLAAAREAVDTGPRPRTGLAGCACLPER